MSSTDGKKRGFASLSLERRREIASMGGHAVPDSKRSFSKDPGLAAKAGSKGGVSVPPEKRSFSASSKLASEAGRKGGLAVTRAKAQARRAGGDI